MKRIILVMIMTAIAVPAMALSEAEAEQFGRRQGRATCRAIENGAMSIMQIAAYVTRNAAEKDFEIMKILNDLDDVNEKDPLLESYTRGLKQTRKPCQEEYNDLPIN